ncbi:hypothetical protein [Polaromonas sp. CG_9.11]|uniref:hypothetical protein n=1 Tax=Polaromonas sp. CG_9.11 TaxID=2787730 RepID=UPI0018C907F9|nr:hypothetical protein [Polaromonas sp. CG_9.11]MBG6077944.1 hypothetical protein [Polaromonas sp. CG_9.11]
MRLVIAMTSLLILLAGIGLLAKKQTEAMKGAQIPAFVQQTAAGPAGSFGAKNPELHPQQIHEQLRQSLEAAMQRPRTVDGE